METFFISTGTALAVGTLASAIYIAHRRKHPPVTLEEIALLASSEDLTVLKRAKISRIDDYAASYKMQGKSSLYHYQVKMDNSRSTTPGEAWIEVIHLALHGRSALYALFEEDTPIEWRVGKQKELRLSTNDSEKVSLGLILQRMRKIAGTEQRKRLLT